MAEKNTLNILQRMANATNNIKGVAKNLTVQAGVSGSYKAVGETDVLIAVRDAEQKNGIYSYPASRELTDAQIIEKQTKNGVRTEYFMRLKTVYRFVNIDDPTDYIEVTSYSDGIDSGDKACGKAMTYGDKYALLKAYKIPTGDDPDQWGSDDNAGKTRGRTAPQKPTREQLTARILKMYTDEQMEIMLSNLKVQGLQELSDDILMQMAFPKKKG